MSMKVIDKERKLCTCCMEEHDVKRVVIRENNTFKGVPVEYDAEYFYCDNADETYADEQQISANDISMKNAYRQATGLLTSDQIAAIRARYSISQSDLCLLLGWGGKTITRYESHQVQDIAHDTILRKLADDPEWFLNLLDAAKDSLSIASYAKYREAGAALFEQDHDQYLKSAIMAKYVRYQQNPEYTGKAALSLDVVVDLIHYYANSAKVTGLYRVKMMLMLWYADALSYKRRGHAISGMVYRALPMGAIPIAYDSIVDLSSIQCEEIDMGEGTGYKFLPSENREYPNLSPEDLSILDDIIRRFGKTPKAEIVEIMYQEDAYIETAPGGIIQFKHALMLSIS
ncbi:MAG: DUF4065 domain-containing protein [Clostridia bacterium]|nr:DUF4065 domain-containing protein [Clostridia bacterium]